MQSALPITYRKLYKLSIIIDEIKNGKRKVSFATWHWLVKKYRRAVRKATSGLQPALKAYSVLALSTLLYEGVAAQCNTFHNADAINPIKHVQNAPAFGSPYFVDIDGDGDLDCYVQRFYYYETPFLFRNVGTNQLPVYQYEPNASGFEGISLNLSTSGEQFVDIDGDGDYDCFLSEQYPIGGTTSDLHILCFENTGTAAKPHFVENEAKNPLASVFGLYDIGFTFADIDGDGDLDIFDYNDFSDETLLNEGTKTNPVYVQVASDFFFNVGLRTYYDWNRDGLPDYFDFFGTYHRNIGPKNNPSYVVDNDNAPHFASVIAPLLFTDINSDGVPEVFNRNGDYSTLAPVPYIHEFISSFHNRNFTKLSVSPTKPAYMYQWYRNGMPIEVATQSAIYALLPGVYTATITDTCGTGVSLPYKVMRNPVSSNYITSEKELAPAMVNSAVQVVVYPNPFSSLITVQLPLYHTAAVVQVTDLQGRILIKEKMNGNRFAIGKQLAAGVYFLQVMENNTLVYTHKIMKE